MEFEAQHALHAIGEILFLFLATPPPFFRFVSNAFADFGLVGRIGKKAEKKNSKRLGMRGLVTQHHRFGAWKQQDINLKRKRIPT